MKKQEIFPFVVILARAAALVARRFDRTLGGLSLHDFIILYHLSEAPDERLRRVDLAQKIGVTASGVTRMLMPMEKIGLVKTEEHTTDARVRYVKLAPGGRRVLGEVVEDAERISGELVVGKEASVTDGMQLLKEVALRAGDAV